MPTPNEFWLALHILCEAYDAEGLAADDRAANISEQFQRMHPIVQKQVLHELQSMALSLSDLIVPVTTAFRSHEAAEAVL